jgi:hypothetical protein
MIGITSLPFIPEMNFVFRFLFSFSISLIFLNDELVTNVSVSYAGKTKKKNV